MVQTSVKLDATWVEVLVEGNAFSWLEKLLQNQHHLQENYREEAQQYLLNLCSVGASTFPNQPDGRLFFGVDNLKSVGESVKRQFLSQLMHQVMQLMRSQGHPKDGLLSASR